jgi:hypothetical protein
VSRVRRRGSALHCVMDSNQVKEMTVFAPPPGRTNTPEPIKAETSAIDYVDEVIYGATVLQGWLGVASPHMDEVVDWRKFFLSGFSDLRTTKRGCRPPYR